MSISRRSLLAAASTAALLRPRLAFAQGDADCQTCRGVGFVPLKNPKPYVFVEGMPLPKPKDAVPHAWCEKCNADKKPEDLVEIEAERLKTIYNIHKAWEKRYLDLFVYVETRHASLHTLIDARQSQQCGQAIEMLCAHLQKLTGTMALTITRPTAYNLFVLWERAGWERFRAAVEKHYTREKLGDTFLQAKDLAGYHHSEVPHFYEKPGGASPVHGALSFFGYEQIQTATNHHAPQWLTEGFSAYCEYAVQKAVRWYSIYQPDQASALGDSLAEVRRMAATKKLSALDRFLKLEIRDYIAGDYPQAFGVVHFLLTKWPVKFLDFARLLRSGEKNIDALEKAFELKVDDLDKQFQQWALTGR